MLCLLYCTENVLIINRLCELLLPVIIVIFL